MHPNLRLLLALNGVDAGTTMVVVGAGLGTELNPVMAVALAISPLFFLLFKVALMDATVFWLHRRWEEKPFRVLAFLMTSAYALLVATQVVGIMRFRP